MIKKYISIIFLLFPIYSFAQLKIEFGEIKKERNRILVEVRVKKATAKTEVYNIYGEDLHYFEQDKNQIYASYVFVPLGNKVKLPPTSIIIQRSSGEKVPMPTPVYTINPSDEFSEKWWLEFMDIPDESANVVIKVMDVQHTIGDMPGAENARKEKNKKATKDKEDKVFAYSEINPKDHLRIKSKIDSIIIIYLFENPNAKIKGTITYSADDRNHTQFLINFNDTTPDSFHKFAEPFLKNITLESLKLGYKVNSRDEYNILVQSGTTRANCFNPGNCEFKPGIEEASVREFLMKNITRKGIYKVDYTYAAVNGQQIYDVSKFNDKRKLSNVAKTLIVVGGVIGVVVIVAMLI